MKFARLSSRPYRTVIRPEECDNPYPLYYLLSVSPFLISTLNMVMINILLRENKPEYLQRITMVLYSILGVHP